jgi:hypothetical protein
MLIYAQEGLLGTYKGSFYTEYPGHGAIPVFSILEITSAENGKIAGKFNITQGYCRGDYVIEGTYQDSKLEMLKSAGALRDCGKETLVVVAQGAKLTGTYGALKIELEKK